ncbi:MAG: type II toxin-antitoxin system MqsA family antitoxin [Methanothrix sp.]
MRSGTHDCCRCMGKMCESWHDFMARVGNEVVVIKDVPTLICDTCGEVEYTQEVSKEIDVIMKDFFARRLLAKPLAAGEIVFSPSVRTRRGEHGLPANPCKRAICRGDHNGF